MIETVFRTDAVPVADRFELWREVLTKTKAAAPAEVSSDHADDYWAEIRILRLGGAHVWPAGMRPMRMRRTARQIRQCDPEVYHLTYALVGAKGTVQAGQEGSLGPHDMHIVDSSRPYEVHVLAPDRARAVGLEIPKRLLPLPLDRVDQLVTRRLSAQEGVGALLAGFLTRLTDDAGSWGPSDGARLEAVLVDLVSAVLAHQLDLDAALPPETHQRTLSLRVQAFIRQHLGDPELTPSAVAAAHHISVSYLHRLFRHQGTTVSAWIRRQRLDRARRELADPAQRAVPVHRIAARWGFPHHAAFTRAFRAAYGLPPSDYRYETLGGRPAR
ncbi:helix-turn-helix domain-containing protein [Streptomyces sp. FXJ1.4098]|uniref:helix-turn-helix domain-containing protein n=1 Tax=Streptomyces sp. NPDC020845 TaxID=3365096 RepID=UPI00299089F6|nr:helix-turn-helix domain-containing protein [Streptomyces sp. FXJ1.4098]